MRNAVAHLYWLGWTFLQILSSICMILALIYLGLALFIFEMFKGGGRDERRS